MTSIPKTQPTFKSFIDHNEDVGTEAMLITGLPGQAKSTIAHHLGSWGLDRGNIIVMRGSKSCEWRHFLNIEACEKITVFISELLRPTKKDPRPIVFKRIPEKYLPWTDKSKRDPILEFKYVDLESLNLEHHVKPSEVFVLYDHCFTPAERTWLIVDQLNNLVNRSDNEFSKDLDEIPVMYIEHEAQVVFPMTPLSPKKKGMSSKQWHAVNFMQNISVDFRKDNMKPVYVAQLNTQFNALLRDLCCFRVLKKGMAGNNMPEPIRRSTPFLEINEANIVVGGGVYLRQVLIDKFQETDKKWKMIPRKMIDYKCREELRLGTNDNGSDTVLEQRNNAIRMLIDCGITQQYIANELELSQQMISKIGAEG